MTFEEMYALACQRKKDLPEGKGFDRIFVKAGETANVELIVPAEDLTTWNTDAHAFTSPGKRARILLGASSQDIRLKKRIRL